MEERNRVAEEELQKAHDELEQKVAEGIAELAVFRNLAESSSQGFGMGDLDGRIVYANPALCRLLGEKPEGIIGKSFLDYYPKEWRERRKNEVIPTLKREGLWQGELTILARWNTDPNPAPHLPAAR